MYSTAQPRQLPPDAPPSVTTWVVNSDRHVRQLVEDAIYSYRQCQQVNLIFADDLGSVASPAPQVLLINVNGPPESSLALLPDIREQWPDVKVLLLSEWDDIHLWAQAIRMGAHDFLPKPIDADQLKWVLSGAFPAMPKNRLQSPHASRTKETIG